MQHDALRFLALCFLAPATFASCSASDAGSVTPAASILAAPTSGPAPSATASASAVPAVYGNLEVNPAAVNASQNVELVSRVTQSPHAYLRFIGHGFAREVCQTSGANQPKARLHGDPHVEQYTVSDLGRGLSDYDQAASGPPAIDLLRMATSLLLATHELGMTDTEQDKLLDLLLSSYLRGVAGEKPAAELPGFAKAMAAKFDKDRTGFLKMAERNMEPLTDTERLFLVAELARYEKWLSEQKGQARSKAFFEVKTQGRLRLGIGSALRKKYLLRLEGPTNKAEDDVVIEFKEVDDLSQVPCVTAIPEGSAERRADEQKSHTAGRTLLLPTYFPETKFWVNEWLANYGEARTKKLKAEDYVGLSTELGMALGREHSRPMPDGSRANPADLQAAAADAAGFRKEARRLAAGVVAGFERFRREAPQAAIKP